MHFSQLIELEFGKKMPFIFMYFLKSFLDLGLLNYLWKERGYPQFSFRIPNFQRPLLRSAFTYTLHVYLFKGLLSRVVINYAKRTVY